MGDLWPSRVLVVEPNDYFFRDVIKPKLLSGDSYRKEDIMRFVNCWDLFNYLFSIKPNKPEIVICYLPFREYRNGVDPTQRSLEEEGLYRAVELCEPEIFLFDVSQIKVYERAKNRLQANAKKILDSIRESFPNVKLLEGYDNLEKLVTAQRGAPSP